jgi:uncharacterized membrane protein
VAAAFLFSLAGICAQPVSAAEPRFRVVDLGGLDGGSPGAFSAAAAINDSGEVAGWTNGYFTASIWSPDGTRRDLPVSQGTNITRIESLGPGGQLLGALSSLNREGEGALLHSGTTPEILAPGASSVAYDINAAGQIVGRFIDRPFLYEGGVLTDLSGGAYQLYGAATDINDSGLILGEWPVLVSTETSSSVVNSTFLYRDGQFQDLGVVAGSSYSTAQGLNNDGLVLANMVLSEGWRAHTWFEGSWTDIGALPGDTASYAWGLGESGAVVGISGNRTLRTGNRAFLYEAGMMFDLTQQLEPGSADWTLTSALGINASGQIAANGCRDGTCRALRLDPIPPVPLPSSAGLLGAGVAFLAGCRRRGSGRTGRLYCP